MAIGDIFLGTPAWSSHTTDYQSGQRNHGKILLTRGSTGTVSGTHTPQGASPIPLSVSKISDVEIIMQETSGFKTIFRGFIIPELGSTSKSVLSGAYKFPVQKAARQGKQSKPAKQSKKAALAGQDDGIWVASKP